MRHTEKIVPISWDGWDDVTDFGMQFYDVVFLEDFGSVKKGEKFPLLFIDFESGIVELYDDNDNVIKRQHFIAHVTEEVDFD